MLGSIDWNRLLLILTIKLMDAFNPLGFFLLSSSFTVQFFQLLENKNQEIQNLIKNRL
jgi:hypothetical protein